MCELVIVTPIIAFKLISSNLELHIFLTDVRQWHVLPLWDRGRYPFLLAMDDKEAQHVREFQEAYKEEPRRVTGTKSLTQAKNDFNFERSRCALMS